MYFDKIIIKVHCRVMLFVNETIPYTKKRRTCEINIRISFVA